MKTQSADFISNAQPRPQVFFWTRCKVDAIFAGGRRLTVEIQEVIGGNFAKLHHRFRGKIPTFDYYTDPRAENALLHHELIIARNGKGFYRVEADKATGATMLDGTQVAIFMRFDEDQAEKGGDDLGFTPLFWSTQQEFDYVHNEVKRVLAEKRKKQQQGEQMAQSYSQRAVRVIYQGKIVATESMLDLSAWFEHRGFPEGVEFRALIQGSYKTLDMHILPKQKGVNHPSPSWLERNPIMCELREAIKDHPVYTGEEKEDDTLISEAFRDRFVDRMQHRPQGQKKGEGQGDNRRNGKHHHAPKKPNRHQRRHEEGKKEHQAPSQEALAGLGEAFAKAEGTEKPAPTAPGTAAAKRAEVARQRQANLGNSVKAARAAVAKAPAEPAATAP